MENKDELKKNIKQFRDRLKEYKTAYAAVWEAIHNRGFSAMDKDLAKVEEELREELTETWGRLETTFRMLKAPLFTVVPSIGYPVYFFDEALSSRYDNPNKGEGLENAISSATKAIGLIDSLSEADFKKLYRTTPTLFISYSFREENERLVAKLKEFLAAFPVAISTGAAPDIQSVSEKVKGLIDDADCVLTILTKDDENATPSKWVSDEVAYALGKKKPVIRLLEKGAVYRPGISGDAEYISFEREDLSDALIKLAQILTGKILS